MLDAVGEPSRATALPLDDGAVTGYRADKVLCALDEPDRAVAEARRYRNLLLDNGFVDVTVEVHTLLWTDAASLPLLANIGEGTWLDDLSARARDDRLFVAVPIFLATGTRADYSGSQTVSPAP